MSAVSAIKQFARTIAPGIYRWHVQRYKAGLPAKVAQVLSDPCPPVTLSEPDFDALQHRYQQWWVSYDFDAYSNGRRAYERALSFLEFEPLREPGKNVLDIACGDGMLGAALSIYGHKITLLDYQDWRDSRAYRQNFIQADLGVPIPLPDSSFDFIFSFNFVARTSNSEESN